MITSKKIFAGFALASLATILTSCSGGGITLKSNDGSTIKLEEDNIYCNESQQLNGLLITCTANGVKTDLTGSKKPFSQVNQICDLRNNVDKEFEDLWKFAAYNIMQSGSPNSIACAAAREKGLIE